MQSLRSLKAYLIKWDNKFPWDLWWRRKYNVPFGSSQHREQSMLAIAIEYIEYVELEKLKSAETDKTSEEDKQMEAELDKKFGIDLIQQSVVKTTKKEEDDMFDDIDLENCNLYGK